jgi:hypothetical protein
MTPQNPTPALAPLREALEAARAGTVGPWENRRAASTVWERLFRAAEACGLLSEAKEPVEQFSLTREEQKIMRGALRRSCRIVPDAAPEPKGKLEVAVEALDLIARNTTDTDAAYWARSALAAIRGGAE